MKRRMNIGIDFDGVITDPAQLKIEWARENCGVILEPQQTVKHKASGIIGGEQRYRQMIDDIYAGSWFSRNKVRPEAIEVMNSLRESGHSLFIITSRFDNEAECARVLLEQWGVKYDEMINVSDGSKLDACRQRKIDVFVDDSLSKLLDLRILGIHLFFFDVFAEGVNTNCIYGISGWVEFAECLDYLSIQR